MSVSPAPPFRFELKANQRPLPLRTGRRSSYVQVSGLTASSSYTVESGSTTLGTISTDANGHGQLSVSDLSPALAAGATITVLDSNNSTVLSGTLASASSSDDEGHAHECSSDGERTTLSATLTGTAGASGTGSFTSNSESGHNSLNVQVSGLSDNSTYTVESGQTLTLQVPALGAALLVPQGQVGGN